LEGLVEDAGHGDDLIGCRAVAAAAEGVVGLIIEGNVEDRAEIEIEAEDPKELSGQLSMAGDEFEISLVAELAGVGRLVAEELETRYTASFLVDGDDRLDIAEFPETVCETTELIGCFYITAEEDESSRLNPAYEIGIGIINFHAWHTKEQKLTGRGAFHSVQETR
jgi:hypothetical protein